MSTPSENHATAVPYPNRATLLVPDSRADQSILLKPANQEPVEFPYSPPPGTIYTNDETSSYIRHGCAQTSESPLEVCNPCYFLSNN